MSEQYQAKRMATLKRIRTEGSMVVGWNEDQEIAPPMARTLWLAGLIRTEDGSEPRVGKKVLPA